jgi:hypothetical protein
MVQTRSLTDALLFKQYQAANTAALNAAVASAVAQVTASLPSNIFQYLASLPNEANGDTLPTHGAYLSGDGLVKVIK